MSKQREHTDFLIDVAICIGILIVSLVIFYFTQGKFSVAIGAAIGAALSALATKLLLRKQTKEERQLQENQQKFQAELARKQQESQRKSLINTEKLKIYQDFMKTLNRVLKDGRVTSEEALELKFKVSLMAMHTKPEHVNKISQVFKDLLGNGKIEGRYWTIAHDQVNIRYLLEMAEALRQEIYDDNSGRDGREFERTVENFTRIDDAFEEQKKNVSDSDSNIKDMNNVIAGKKGWEDKRDEQQRPICLCKDESLVMVERESDGNWYYFVRCPGYTAEVRREFYKHLRRTYGGGYQTNGAGWWLPFGEEHKTMSLAEFDKAIAEQNDFRAAVYGRIKSLVELVDKCNVLAMEVQPQLRLSDKWMPFLYLWETGERGHCLAMEVYEHIDERQPFIDFWLNNEGSYSVVLSLRKGEDHLKEYLDTIGLSLDGHRGEDGRWLKEFDDLKSAINCALDLIGKVERALPTADTSANSTA